MKYRTDRVTWISSQVRENLTLEQYAALNLNPIQLLRIFKKISLENPEMEDLKIETMFLIQGLKMGTYQHGYHDRANFAPYKYIPN